MFEGFTRHAIAANGITLHTLTKGDGPPVLLLHGYPQTHAMWHAVAPILADRFSVVLCDLRGYGASSKVEGSASHIEYSKRTMAADVVAVMRALGHQTFSVIGHDRGARVTHRLCLDYPEAVTKAAVLDIVPTHTIFATLGKDVALDYYHWLFLAQPHPLPERLIGNDPDFYLDWTLGAWGTGLDTYAPEALAAYRAAFHAPGTIHAMCEDYRAAATIDLEHDEADLSARIQCPLLVMWGTKGLMEKNYDVVATWQAKAETVVPAPVAAGHFLVEECPDKVADTLVRFLTS